MSYDSASVESASSVVEISESFDLWREQATSRSAVMILNLVRRLCSHISTSRVTCEDNHAPVGREMMHFGEKTGGGRISHGWNNTAILN